MAEKDYKDLFIAFEGISASGRSTQTALLAQHFLVSAARYDLLVVHEPPQQDSFSDPALEIVRAQRDPYFGKDRKVIEEVFIRFARVREETSQNRIRPHLIKGGIAIADGYEGHGVIQVAQGYPPAKVVARNRMMEEPDITFVLDVPVFEQQKRLAVIGGPRDVFERHPEFQGEVRRGYRTLDNLFDGKNVVVLDGAAQIQEIHQSVAKAVEQFVLARSGNEA